MSNVARFNRLLRASEQEYRGEGAFEHKAKPTAINGEIGDMLRGFRQRWSKQRQWGLKQDLSLPALNNKQTQEAIQLAYEHYWNPNAFTICGDHKGLLKETRRAIVTANACFAASQRGPSHTKGALRDALRERDGDDCWVCGAELRDDTTFEHKIALANGGTWEFSNIALAHPECNKALARLPLKAKEAARQAIQGDAS